MSGGYARRDQYTPPSAPSRPGVAKNLKDPLLELLASGDSQDEDACLEQVGYGATDDSLGLVGLAVEAHQEHAGRLHLRIGDAQELGELRGDDVAAGDLHPELRALARELSHGADRKIF